jgi:hypothetical protein
MLKTIARSTLKSLNAALGPAGVQIIRNRPRPYEEFQDFIPFEKTIAAAREKGLSVGDYIDAEHNRAGVTQEHFDRLKDMGAVHTGMRRVCEIGPGSGRYLERVIGLCHPDRYEIYETAQQWRDYLVETYPVVSLEADGRSLSHTPDGSVDLVHAHKVLPGIPFLVTCRYFLEMARVAAPGGKVVFDVVTERCMDDATLDAWFASGAGYQYYPSLMPRQYVVDFFERRGFNTDGSFIVPMRPGATESFVFTRKV